MKKILSFSILILLAMVMVACNNDEEASSENGNEQENNSGEQVQLTFWGFGSTNYEELAKEYEEMNPNIKINVRIAETADHHDALFTALSAGSGAPDMAMLEIDQLDRFKQAQDRFANLYDYGASEVQDLYLDWKWETAENLEGDFLLGMPTDIGPKALYYRVDVFEEAGLPTDPDEVSALINSPEALIEAGTQVKENTGKPFVDSMEMAYRAYLDPIEETYLNPEGELLLENAGNQVKEAYDYAVQLNELGLVGNFELWSAEWSNAVNQGDFAAKLGAGWLKGWMEGNAPEASGYFRVATLPSEFAANWGGSFISVPAETDHPQEAYDFIEWLVSPESQLKSSLSHGMFPSAPSVYEMEEFTASEDEFFGGQNTAEVFIEAVEDINGTVYKGERYFPIHQHIVNALENVQQGGDPETEWEEAVKRAKDTMSR